MRRRAHEPETPWASFADVLSGMLFVFILTTFWFAIQAKQRVRQAETREKTAADEAVEEMQKGGVFHRCLMGAPVGEGYAMKPVPYPKSARMSLYLTRGEGKEPLDWFDTGKAALQPGREEAAARLGDCVTQLVGATRGTYHASVFIEGHTDAQRFVDPSDPSQSNWELSGGRAAAVLRTMLELNPALRVMVETGEVRVVSSGMAHLQPAWEAICEEVDRGRGDPADHDICRALRAGANREGSEAEIDAPPDDVGPCDPSLFESDLTPVQRWANRCVNRQYTWLGLLRRVDVRLELEPTGDDDD